MNSLAVFLTDLSLFRKIIVYIPVASDYAIPPKSATIIDWRVSKNLNFVSSLKELNVIFSKRVETKVIEKFYISATISEILAHDHINCIYHDQDGYVRIGTRERSWAGLTELFVTDETTNM